MNDELFLGPVTIIAVLLAVFFVAMAFFRHLGAKRLRAQHNRPEDKPYRISNPYEATAAPTAPAPPPAGAAFAPPPAATEAASDPSGKIFRQFEPGAAGSKDKSSDPSGYLWE